jgi:hypothetical protein
MGRTRVARWLIFKPKNPNLGKFLRALDWEMLIWPFGIFKRNWGFFMTI